MSGGKKQTQRREIPTWLEQGSQQAVGQARDIADRPYQAFEGQRVADLSSQEQQAMSLTSSGTGAWRPDLQRSRELANRGAQTFMDADVEAYMNPYVEGALEPAARELREETSRNLRSIGGQAAKRGAFGGSRQAILESEAQRGGSEALSDLYSRGYAQAFESAGNRFERDRQAAQRGAEQFRAIGAQGQQQLQRDIESLLRSGGLKRRLEQAGLDFDFQQFREARDWDVTNLQPLLSALSSVPHGETQTTGSKSSGLGQIVGLASTAAGAFMSGGGNLAGMFGGGGGGGSSQLEPIQSSGTRMMEPYPQTFAGAN